jgi:hypothetical protein
LQPSRPSEDLAMLRGSLAVVSATDLLEWLCCNGRTGVLRLHDAKPKAQVVILSGQIVDATWHGLRGLDALCEIVGCEQGSFDLVPASPGAERTLHGNWQTLLLSAAQLLDERNHGDSQSSKGDASAKRKATSPSASRSSERLFALPFPDEPKTRPNIDAQDAQTQGVAEDPAQPPPTAQDWIDQGFSALRARDTERARACWTTALAMQPTNRSLRFNLRKLDEAAAPSTKTK